MIDAWLLKRLVCPVTRTPLRHDEAADELVSDSAGLAYPIRDGMPVLLAEEARAFGQSDRITRSNATATSAATDG